MENLIFDDKITEWAIKYGEKTAVIDTDGTEYSYTDLRYYTDRFAGYFYSIGVRKNDKVIVQLNNSAALIFSMTGLFRIGAVPIMVLPAYRENELNGIIGKTDAHFYLSQEENNGEDYVSVTEKLKQEHPSIEKLIFESDLYNVLYSDNEYPIDQYKEKIEPDDIALLLLSGGTTSIPKLIPRTHNDYIYNNRKAAEKISLNENDIYLAFMPIAHNFTLGAPGIFGTFYVGGTVVVSDSIGSLDLLEEMSEYNVTYTSIVPSLLLILLETLEIDDSLYPNDLRMILVGGSMLDPALAERADSMLNGALVQVFGTAEGLICMTDPDDDISIKSTVQGKPISELDEIRIVDEEFNDLCVGQAGHLITRGPYTIRSYYGADRYNDSFTEDGFYCTGDKARITADGNLQILGRIREQINRMGEKIMPSDIEELVLKNTEIYECAVVGVPDEEKGALIVAYIIGSRDFTVSEINSFLKENGMAVYKLLDQVLNIDTMPLTAFGKIDKKELTKIAVSEMLLLQKK